MNFLKNKIFLNILYVSAIILAGGFFRTEITHAATTPSLGAAATYGVLAGTFTNTSASTTISGDVGYTTGPDTPPTVVNGTNYGSSDPTALAKTNAATALDILNAESCTPAFTFGSATDLSLESQPLTPGVYCITGAVTIGTGGITLNGTGTYIFRILGTGTLDTVANSEVRLTGGANAGDVFWTPIGATTLGATSTFKGNIIQTASAITVGAYTNWVGRALPFAGTVTTGDTDSITVPTSTPPVGTVALSSSFVNVTSSIQTVTVTYNKSMNASPEPTITFSSGTFTPGVGVWSTSTNPNDTWTQTFTSSALEEINGISVSSSGATDLDSNPESASVAGSNNPFNLDTIVPTVTITNDQSVVTNIAAGNILYTFNFSQPVTGFASEDITVGHGTKGIFAAARVVPNTHKLLHLRQFSKEI